MKVGDKYIIEIEEVIRRNGAPQIARIKGFNALVFDKCGLDKLEPYDGGEKVYRKGYVDGMYAVVNESEKITSKDISDAYNKGLNDAWEAAGELLKMPYDDFFKLFEGKSPYFDSSAQEVIEKLAEYEDKQKQDTEIKVGDEVIDNANQKGVVVQDVYDFETRKYTTVWYGCYLDKKRIENLTKTGRHFDAIAEVLSELRGKE